MHTAPTNTSRSSNSYNMRNCLKEICYSKFPTKSPNFLVSLVNQICRYLLTYYLEILRVQPIELRDHSYISLANFQDFLHPPLPLRKHVFSTKNKQKLPF